MSSVDALYRSQLGREERPGQIGQGIKAASIERIRDRLLENRILAQSDDAGYWRTRDAYLLQVEQIHLEPYGGSVRTLMDKFWEAWQELSVNPDGEAERQSVLRRGEALMAEINRRYSRLKEVRNMMDDDLVVSVGEVNSILADIKALNEEIVKSEAMDDNPNDLYDRRDLLVNKLADYLPVTVDSRDPDEFLIHTEGLHLIQGARISYIEVNPNPDNEGYHDIRWEANNELLIPRYGKLGSLLELRDIDVRSEIRSLDEMTMAFADLVNEIHIEAWSPSSTTGTVFFREYPFVDNASGNYDRSGDGVLDSTYVYRLRGSNALDSKAVIGFAGIITIHDKEGLVDIPYTAVDTVEMVLDRINSSAREISFRLSWDGRLEIRAGTAEEVDNPDFVIRHVEDSGQFLVGYAGLLEGSGPPAAYDWQTPDAVLSLRSDGATFSVSPLSHPSGWLRVNEELISDPSKVAASLSETGRIPSRGDNRAALAIAQLRHRPVLASKGDTFDDWFALAAADIGLKGEIAAQTNESQNLVMKELEDLRQSISGVNLDEEFSEMIKFQHGYNAAARFITVIDKMLETIISRLGV